MDINEQIEAFKEFFDDTYKTELYSAVMQGKRSFAIDFTKLAAHNPELTELLTDHPEDLVKAAEMAVEQFDLPKPVKHFRIRFFNLPNSQKLKIADIRSEHLGRFLWIEAIVRQSSDIRPQVTNAKFECAGCGNTISILQIDQKFKEPSRCTCGWRGKFRLLSKDLVDVQHLKVEEVPEVLEGGEQPKRLSIFLQEDLVEARMEKRTAPGAKIAVQGIVKEVPIPLKTGAQSTRYDIVMEANNVVPVQEDFSDIVLNAEDIEKIREFAKDPRVYEKFTKSIAPSIYGHERIKQALILQLMGGVRKVKEDGTITRGDIHMLLIGDPGAGKSQMLSFIAKVAPKARFVSGKGSTGTGLTAAVVKDEFLKGWSLEAGALVLANKGICCLHPDTNIVIDNKITTIEKFYNKTNNNEQKFSSNGESVFVNELNHNVTAFDLKKCSIINENATKIRRKMYKGDLLKIKFNSGFELLLTPDHKLINGNSLEWNEAIKFSLGDFVVAPTKNLKGHRKLKIISVETVFYEGYVYDLFVPTNHNFVANGVFVHNCVDELDKMSDEDRSALHEALEQQCVLPDFKLMLSNGTSVEIGKFVDDLMEKNKNKVYEGKDCEILPVENIKLLSTNFIKHFSINADRVSRYLAPKKFIKIKLTNGREIIVTPEHPCWVVEGGKIITMPASKLTNNMYFPIPSELKINSTTYEPKNDYLCKILGYHLSDGCYELNRGKKVGIQFWNNDKILIDDYKSSIEKFFGIVPGITRRKHQFAVRVISKKVFEYFKNMSGNLTEKGDTKKIPEEIMHLPNKNLKYLLAAIYDGDGTVVFQRRNGCRVSLVSQNRELMEQVSDILLRFGIQSSIFRDKTGHVWILDTSGQENLSKFLLNITFLSKHKRKRLEEYCSKTKTYRSIKDIIPGCTNKIDRLFRQLGISATKEIGHVIDLGVEKHRLFLQKLVVIAEKKLRKIEGYKEGKYFKLEEELAEIKKLAFGYARWMKIKDVSIVKNEGIKWVYDVTIEPYHTFISNGMILHNTITISKANIQATLRAETTMLAAANPKLGRFDPYAPIAAQIDLPSTLINRFDLIFPIRDIPNKEKDEKIALHVLEAMHKEETYQTEVSPDFLKKYLSYVKTYVNPVMTKAAVNEIKDFYVSLRNSGKESNEGAKPIPISARQLEALIRLSQASARVRLDDKVTREDARRAIDLLSYCLMQVGFDPETGQIDIDRMTTGMSASTRNRIMVVKEIIDTFTKTGLKEIPFEEIVAQAIKKGLEENKVEEVVEQLRRSGEVFEPKKGFIQKI